LEQARTKKVLDEAKQTAEREQEILDSVVRVTTSKHQDAEAALAEATSLVAAKQARKDTAETEEKTAEQKTEALMTTEKRARDTLADAKEKSNKADTQANAASVAHTKALEALQDAQTDLANAKQKLADVKSHNAEVAAADEQAEQSARDMLDKKATTAQEKDTALKSEQESLAALKQKRNTVDSIESQMELVADAVKRKQDKLVASEGGYQTQAEAIHTDVVNVAAKAKAVQTAVSDVDHAVQKVVDSHAAIDQSHKKAQEHLKDSDTSVVNTAKAEKQAEQDLVGAQEVAWKAAISKGDAKRVLDTIMSQKQEQEARKVAVEESKSKSEASYQVTESKYILEDQAAQKATQTWKDSHAKVVGEHFKVKNREQEELAARQKASLLKKQLLNDFGVDATELQGQDNVVQSLDGSQGSLEIATLDI